MKKQVQFFALMIAMFAVTSIFAQGAGKVSMHDISFNADNMEAWDVKTIKAGATGQQVLAISKTDRTKFVVVLRNGKIAQVGIIPVGGSFKALQPSSAPCNTIQCTTFQIKHCFQVNGQCVCVCGAWITSYPGN
jgi:hypothetical protein